MAERIRAVAQVVGNGMPVHRALPTRPRRMVGPWCFLDHIGPAEIERGEGLRVGPHPHIGVQTVTWLTQGELLHRDSLGSLQSIKPGQLNVMTSGRAIAHSEESPENAPRELHGLQFWVALPESARFRDPAFDHHAELPVMDKGGFRLTLIQGEAFGERSPARAYSPILGLELVCEDAAFLRLPLRRDFEYAVLALDGEVKLGAEVLEPDTLLYLGSGATDLPVRTSYGAQLMLIGGAPFGEEILMWWNFVARSREELTAACLEWNGKRGEFGEVLGYDGPRLTAPMPPWASTPL